MYKVRFITAATDEALARPLNEGIQAYPITRYCRDSIDEKLSGMNGQSLGLINQSTIKGTGYANLGGIIIKGHEFPPAVEFQHETEEGLTRLLKEFGITTSINTPVAS